MAEITLSAAIRTNLSNLQTTAGLLGQTQTRLATGKRVNSALDNPSNFFAAVAHTQRASDLTNRKDGLNEAIQGIKQSDTAITALTGLLNAAKGILETARTTPQSGLSGLYTQFNAVTSQINTLINDSGYKGTNFLTGSSVTLDVLFNETGSNKLTVTGFNGNVSGLLDTAAGNVVTTAGGYSALGANITNISAYIAGTQVADSAVGGFSADAGFSLAFNLNTISDGLTAAVAQLQVQSAKFASNLSIVNIRLDFTNSTVNNEKTGADNLTLADQNEEGANLLSLQTRNQLGTTSLSLASQAAQSILKLF